MTYTINDNHILQGDQVTYTETTGKDSGLFGGGLPDTLVMHYTAGSSLDSAVRTLRNPSVKASAHLVVGKDGKIVQLIPFNKIAWHAGRSSYGDRSGLNKYSIGIEMDNAGPLTKSGSVYKTWYGGVVPEEQVFTGVHRNQSRESHWQEYPEKQMDTVFDLCEALCERYGIKTVVGHEEIAPTRKTDPGPAFPLDRLRSYLLEDRGSDDETVVASLAVRVPHTEEVFLQQGVVTASKLNFRQEPDLNSGMVSDPLPEGTELEILEDRNGWYKVKVSKTGWVNKNYVRVG